MVEKTKFMRLDLAPKTKLREKFDAIQEELGVVSNTEVLRSVISRYRLKRSKSND